MNITTMNAVFGLINRNVCTKYNVYVRVLQNSISPNSYIYMRMV